MGSLKKAAKNQGNNGRWDESFKEDIFQIPGKHTPVRLWNSVTEIRQHWVEFVSKTKGKTGYGELCPNWDPTTESDVDGGCPLCERGKRPTIYYYAFLLNRKAQTKTGSTVVQPVRLTAKLAGKIGKLSEIVYQDQGDDAPDATDPKKGFDVFVSQTNVNSKIEYDAQPGDKKPLTKEEIEAFTEYVEEHEIGKMAKPFIKSRTDLLEKLANMNVEGFGRAPGSVEKDRSGNTAAKRRNYEEYDTAPDDDEDPASPPARGKGQEKAQRRASLTGDDDDEETSGARVRPARKSRLDDDDEEEQKPKPATRQYANADDDDAPAVDDDEG